MTEREIGRERLEPRAADGDCTSGRRTRANNERVLKNLYPTKKKKQTNDILLRVQYTGIQRYMI